MSRWALMVAIVLTISVWSEPTTRPVTAADIEAVKALVAKAEAQIAVERAAALDKFKNTDMRASLVKAVKDAEAAKERTSSGSPEEKLSAATALLDAKRALRQAESAAVDSDRHVIAAIANAKKATADAKKAAADAKAMTMALANQSATASMLKEKQDQEAKAAWSKVARDKMTRKIGPTKILVDAWVGKPKLETLDRVTSAGDEFLVVLVTITNESTERKVDYEGWANQFMPADKGYARVSDDVGNSYKRITAGGTDKWVGQVETRDSIYPRRVLTDILIFEKPTSSAKVLTLTLPASNLGGKGEVKVDFPVLALDK